MAEQAVPPAAADRIRSAVLQIHSRKLEGAKLDTCLREAYDAYARELLPSGILESDEVLSTRIPGWVFRDAVEFEWIPYPPQRSVRRETIHYDFCYWGAPTIWFEDVPVPAEDLTDNLGGYRVNPEYARWVARLLAGGIAFWKGEAIRLAAEKKLTNAQPGNEPREEMTTTEAASGPDGLQPGARAAFVMPILDSKGWSVLDWATESHLDFHTANDFLKDKTKPFRSTRKKLAEGLGVAVEALPK